MNYHKESKQKDGMFFSRDAVIVHELWGEYAFLVLFIGIVLFFAFLEREFIFYILGIIELFFLYKLFHALISMQDPLVFDILNGTFYPEGRSHSESAVPMKEIDHLRIMEIDMKSRFCYELNAVLKDSKPLHIIGYSTYSKCVADAQKLAERLTLPLKGEHGELLMDLPENHTGPLSSGGECYQDTYLVFKEDSISLHIRLGIFLLYIFQMLGCLFAIGFSLFNFDSLGDCAFIAIVIGVLMCIYIPFVCYKKWKKQTAPFFDMLDDMFYPNRFNRDSSGISLKQLDHLEILTKHVSEDHKNYDSQELNLVLKDGSRYNILNHANKKRLLADARHLSQRLFLPIIDTKTNKSITSAQHALLKEAVVPRTKDTGCFEFVFGVIYSIIICYVCWTSCIQPLSGWLSSANWTPCKAKVISSVLAQSRGYRCRTNYRIKIQYTYKFNGTTYKSFRYDFFRSQTPSNNEVDTMRKIVSNHPKGKVITCLVNPKNPHESVISREFPDHERLSMLLLLPGPLLGFSIILIGIQKLRQ